MISYAHMFQKWDKTCRINIQWIKNELIYKIIKEKIEGKKDRGRPTLFIKQVIFDARLSIDKLHWIEKVKWKQRGVKSVYPIEKLTIRLIVKRERLLTLIYEYTNKKNIKYMNQWVDFLNCLNMVNLRHYNCSKIFQK
jgi:hypothetical protein